MKTKSSNRKVLNDLCCLLIKTKVEEAIKCILLAKANFKNHKHEKGLALMKLAGTIFRIQYFGLDDRIHLYDWLEKRFSNIMEAISETNSSRDMVATTNSIVNKARYVKQKL